MARARRDGDHPRAQPSDVDREGTVGRRAVTELSGHVGSPTPHATPRGERTRVVRPSRDRDNPGAQTGDVDRGGAVGGRAVAELSPVVQAPTTNPTAAEQRAIVKGGGLDGEDVRAQTDDIDGNEAPRIGTVAELAVVAEPPALRR